MHISEIKSWIETNKQQQKKPIPLTFFIKLFFSYEFGEL